MALMFRLFGDEIYDPFLSMVSRCPVLNTPTDWKETPEAHVFTLDLPGLKKEEENVEVDDERVLKIYGERKEEKDDENDKWHRRERCRGKFRRSFELPENSKTDGVKASMENGVLAATVPKQEVKKAAKKMIPFICHFLIQKINLI
ncbi:17.5 kDa class I heat shock protein [Hibiscus syriacus]|uniref:17.5 kDa class I heat shock protein n=1 Tax=Hibiscus syriacus TaxID=106335 RepID=A0A6A3ATQ2_HIBSY|nr:17.8 kDa class I heat shock protein-like [Hibiscus syriacus]KAE8706272.1 17.5 kDa class I heat shock protein [Hibiscus syriacus]